jgi:hypothetical protein
MRFRKENPGESGAETRLTSSEEMRELAEAVSLYRSAMRHVAEKQAERPYVRAERRAPGLRMRFVLVPALGAALAAAVITPTVVHLRHSGTTAIRVAPPEQAAAPPTTQQASVEDTDTDLMNQIDSEVSEDVPDALQPLADLSDQAAAGTTTTNAEKKEHATQK